MEGIRGSSESCRRGREGQHQSPPTAARQGQTPASPVRVRLLKRSLALNPVWHHFQLEPPSVHQPWGSPTSQSTSAPGQSLRGPRSSSSRLRHRRAGGGRATTAPTSPALAADRDVTSRSDHGSPLPLPTAVSPTSSIGHLTASPPLLSTQRRHKVSRPCRNPSEVRRGLRINPRSSSRPERLPGPQPELRRARRPAQRASAVAARAAL